MLHLFCKPRPGAEARSLVAAIEMAEKDACQVVTAAMLGHKADVCVLALGPDLRRLRQLQTELQTAGLDVVDSYVSLTEVSEYAAGVPEEMKQARLYPQLPPDGKPAMCFYPMSKRRAPGAEKLVRGSVSKSAWSSCAHTGPLVANSVAGCFSS